MKQFVDLLPTFGRHVLDFPVAIEKPVPDEHSLRQKLKPLGL
jgi:hypothetical protein